MVRDVGTGTNIYVIQDLNPLSPHGERHPFPFSAEQLCNNFNPLSTHEERLQKQHDEMEAAQFQSTLPAWGETLLGR